MKIAYSLYGKILTLFFRNIIHKYLQNMFFFFQKGTHVCMINTFSTSFWLYSLPECNLNTLIDRCLYRQFPALMDRVFFMFVSLDQKNHKIYLAWQFGGFWQGLFFLFYLVTEVEGWLVYFNVD